MPLHQTVSGIINYLSIYQTKSDMINYLTISSEIQIYQPKSDMINYVKTSGDQNINGLKHLDHYQNALLVLFLNINL